MSFLLNLNNPAVSKHVSESQPSHQSVFNLRKKMTCDLGVQDKEPLALFEIQGFRRFLKREFPAYIVPDRHKVAKIASLCLSTEVICERLFKAGGQMLISARLRLMGSRVESLLMTKQRSSIWGYSRCG